MADSFWMALGLVLVLEGLLPLISPRAWRQMLAQVQALRDGQIRFVALLVVALGLLVLAVR